jgi:hypothetical protein
MAHFFNPFRAYDEHYVEGKGASVAVKGELKLGFWAGSPDLMQQFVVKPDNPALADIRDQAVPFGDLPDVRYFTITGLREGQLKIEARLGDGGPVWAWMPLNVGDRQSASNQEGKIVFIGGISADTIGTQSDLLREMYGTGNEKILQEARDMITNGKSESEVARWIVESRNNLKEVVRTKGPIVFKKLVEYRNLKKYGNALGPSYEMLRAAGKTDAAIIAGVTSTSKDFNSVGGKISFIGTVGEVVGFAFTAAQNSPASLPPLPKSEQDQILAERARLRFGIPASANIDRHGHLKKSSYLQIELFDPHAGDELASETEEILWAIGVDISYHYRGVSWTVPGY